MSDETDDDLVERLKNAERELRNAEAKLVKITSERKVAKELVEDLQLELRKLTSELAEPKTMPLFDGDDEDDEEDEEPIKVTVELEPARVDWKATPIDQVEGIPVEALEAFKADGVTTIGEYATQMESGGGSEFSELGYGIQMKACEAIDKVVVPHLPHCRACGTFDEEWELGKEANYDTVWIEGEDPPLCEDCLPLKDGAPALESIETIPADPEQNWTLPECLRKKPLKAAAGQLKRLKDGYDEEAGRLAAHERKYSDLVAVWPAIPASFPKPSHPGADGRGNFIFNVLNEIEAIGKARGRLLVIQAEIDKVQAQVDAEAEAKAKKPAKKKATA